MINRFSKKSLLLLLVLLVPLILMGEPSKEGDPFSDDELMNALEKEVSAARGVDSEDEDEDEDEDDDEDFEDEDDDEDFEDEDDDEDFEDEDDDEDFEDEEDDEDFEDEDDDEDFEDEEDDEDFEDDEDDFEEEGSDELKTQAPKTKLLAPIEDEDDFEDDIEELQKDSKLPKRVNANSVEKDLLSEIEAGGKEIASVESMPSNAVQANVRDLQFRMVGQTSQIQISFDNVPIYRQSRSSELSQAIFFFTNTRTPDRFQRAYDTTEFVSPVGIFSLIELKNTNPVISKMVVHLRENKVPVVRVQGKELFIEFPGPDFEAKKVVPGVGSDSLSAMENNIYVSGRTFTGKKIERLEIKNSDIQDVLRLIARSSSYNIVVGEDVTGKIGTLSLTGVPWDQAFTMVLQSKKLGYVKQGNVIRVATLDALKAEKEAALANEESKIKVEPLHTVLIPVSYAAAKDMADRAKTFLTSRGSIDTDERSNTILIKDIENVVERVKRVITALDTQPPRVSISAKVVEVLSTLNRTLGFSGLSAASGFAGTNINTSFGSDELSFGGISTTTLTSEGFANLNATFSIQELDNKVRVLANPVVSAISNQQASVTQGVSFFITQTTIVNNVPQVTIQEVTANLSLEVTPIVSGDGAVFMKVNITNQVPQGTGTETRIQSRNVETEVLVENGDTAVIAGVFNSSVNMSHNGIPFLKHLPIIGFFTSQKSKLDSRNEILVFLTPKILNEQKAFKQTI